MDRTYFVYILTNKTHSVLYTGVTNDLPKRVYQHKTSPGTSFASKYRVNKVVYYEVHNQIDSAIAREKQIKAGSRAKKLALINKMNPGWDDFASQF